jgi:hypothetical protein
MPPYSAALSRNSRKAGSICFGIAICWILGKRYVPGVAMVAPPVVTAPLIGRGLCCKSIFG